MKRVRDLMTTNPRTLGRNDLLKVADDLMTTERIRHLPVLDDAGNLAGILTQRDLFHGALVRALGFGSAAREKMLTSIPVKEVMNGDVETTTPSTPLAYAAREMVARKIGCLPVVEHNALVGILTEGDFVALVATMGV